MNKCDIQKCINDSSDILRGLLGDVLDTKKPAGFLMADRIEHLFKERMEVWGKFETLNSK